MINHPNRSKSRPNTNDVRKHYKRQGYKVRINREGHVEFRREGETMWLEGRYVSEYRFIDGNVMLV